VKRCPNCGFEGAYSRTNCPNCGYSATTADEKPPWGQRVLLAAIVFPISFVGSCLTSWPFTYSVPGLFYVVPYIVASVVCIVCDKVLMRMRISKPVKPVKPDNDIRFAPEEALFWSKSNEQEDKDNAQ